MNPQDQPQQLPYIPASFATVRASAIVVGHLNGAFVITVIEDRIVKGDQRLTAANFEIGRYFVNVPTVLALAQSSLAALKAYQDTFGQFPTQLLAPGTPNVDDAIRSLEEMLQKRPPQGPETPLS